MKNETLLVLVAAAAGVGLIYFMTSRAGKTTATTAGAGSNGARANNGNPLGVNEIPNTALPGSAGYGWHYYTDGTAIDPTGNYYQNGQLVYQNQGAY